MMFIVWEAVFVREPDMVNLETSVMDGGTVFQSSVIGGGLEVKETYLLV